MTNRCENGTGRGTQQREDIVPDRGPTIKLNEHEKLVFSSLLQKMINDGVQIGKARQLLTVAVVKRKVDFVKFKRISTASLFNSEETRHRDFLSKIVDVFSIKDVFLDLSPTDS